jgi:hypothetical protein
MSIMVKLIMLPEHPCTLVKKQWLGDAVRTIETGACGECESFFWQHLARNKEDENGLVVFLADRTEALKRIEKRNN